MPLLYPLKRVFRNWKLYIALLIGITLASTFFAGIDVKANLAAKQALDQRLNRVIVDMEFKAALNSTNLNLALNNISSIDGVKKVDVVSRFRLPISLSSDNYTTPEYTTMACTPNSSQIYDEWLNKPLDGIGENETYILADTPLARRVAIGDNITTMINFPTPKFDNITTVYLNLTVAGFAELSQDGYALLTGNTYYVSPYNPSYSSDIYKPSFLVFSWENTLEKVWLPLTNRTIDVTFSIYIDRDKLISPWNSEASAENIQTVADNIQNTVLANYEMRGNVDNRLQYALTDFGVSFSLTFFNFIVVSLPIFFVAWYIGSTVSDVSFNLRRREIGLLSTKGLSSGQIQRMFLAEALAIGLIGGVLGVVGGLILNQAFTGGTFTGEINLNNLFSAQTFNPFTMVFTVIVGVVLALFSVFWSARRAARMPAVEALREYMPSDVDKSYRKKLPWVAFILGAFKIGMLISGVNMQTLVSNIRFFGGNYFIAMLLTPLLILDQLLTYIGPLLFFWGTTRLLILNSLKFQQLVTKFSLVMGDLGALAAKNVRRSPKRLAAIAFVIALIIGYSVQVTGQVASEQDYTIRQVQYQVGADVILKVSNATKGQEIFDNIVANVSGIKNATMECELQQAYAGTIMRTIDPGSWAATAYYENEWFSGVSMQQAFNDLKGNNMTIILERRVAKQYNYQLYDEIGIDFPSGARKLRIVGFFGPEPTEMQQQGVVPSRVPAPDLAIIQYGGMQMWSFVPRNLFNMSSPFSDAYELESFDTKIMLRLNEGANSTKITQAIKNLDLDLEIYGIDTFDAQWQKSQSMDNPYTYNTLQVLDVQQLGLVFAVLSASVGTVLICVVSLKERTREATIMSVRGLSYRQLVWMFLSENIAVITFSVILGVVIGLIIVYGNVTMASSVTSELIKKRLVFPTDFIVTIGTYISLIYAAAIGSILIMTSQYVTKLERMIRTR